MKKFFRILAIVLAVLIVVGVAALVVFLVTLPSSEGDGGAPQEVQDYLQAEWPEFPVEEYDAEAGRLVLSYQTAITFEQAQKYGQSAGYDEVALGHISTMNALRSACASACGVSLKEIIVHGYSSDGEIIYTVTDSGDLTACWMQ